MPRALRHLGSFAVVALLATACASAPLNKKATAELAQADALVAEGCYDCLTDALAIYQRVGVGKARPLVVARLFETEVLLALRLKELSLAPNDELDAAKALVAELPASFPAAMYLEIAEALPSDPGGGMPKLDVARAVRALTQPPQPRVKDYKAFLSTGPSAILRDYLTASIDCTIPTGEPIRLSEIARGGAQALQKPGPSAPQATPLLTYRRANCLSQDRPALIKLVTDTPRWVEAGAFVARVRSLRPGASEIHDSRLWLAAAEAKWPRSSTVNYGLGVLNQTAGDCRAAVGYYDKTLREYGQHEDAHLGKLMCLSYLGQHDDAIVEATGMIVTKINIGEAYYWRAWNKRELKLFPAARRDSDLMKTTYFNERAMTLAGQIEYDVDDLPIAEKDLTDAVRLGHGENCVAQWYWSLVQLKKQAWPQTADGFSKAMECYNVDRVKTMEALKEMTMIENVDADWKKGQILNFQAVIKEDESQISAAAFNAAVNFARAQNREKALEYLDIAAKDPDRAAAVDELRKLIVK
jgi:tetratricopeptide (TPR) repeat protein